MKTKNDLYGVWTRVLDNNSGGTTKIKDFFYQGNEKEAMNYVYSLGYDPYGVECDCCGSNFSFDESNDIIKLAIHFFIQPTLICEWDYMAKRVKDGELITYKQAQKIVLDYINGKPNDYGYMKFIFKDMTIMPKK